MLPLLHFDRSAIEHAIKAAELRTSGEIKVYVERREHPDVMSRAKAVFQELGMTNTRDHTGVLFYVHLRQKQFVVLGDSGINDKVGQQFWDSVRDSVIACFQRGEMTVGIVLGIMLTAEHLARLFPACDGPSCNELSDSIVMGK